MTDDAERLEEIRKQFEYVHEISVEDAEFIVAQLDRANKRCAVLRKACEEAKEYHIDDLIEPGRTVFWNLVRALKTAERISDES